jgi:hypothetical protein
VKTSAQSKSQKLKFRKNKVFHSIEINDINLKITFEWFVNRTIELLFIMIDLKLIILGENR